MEIIGKVSKGSKMDQIYIPKNRVGFAIGNYVIIKPLEKKEPIKKLYFYKVKGIGPLKLEIIKEVISVVENNTESYENIIITGSFLDEGFNFNDIDVLILTENKINHELVKKDIEKKLGIKAHIINLSNKDFIKGLETDPLYKMMLSRCVSKKRIIYNVKNKINYKLLDLHLLKSKILIDNFEVLSGNEKYYLVRNTIAIYLYLKNIKLNVKSINKEIKKIFGLDIQPIKQNLVDKKTFLKKYKLIYDKTFSIILKGIKNGAK